MQVMWERRVRGDDGNQVTITGPPQQKLRVLVVDDHDTNYCFDGVSALQSLATFQPDVFLLDIAMPWMDGYELAMKQRSAHPSAGSLFIAISGYADARHRARGLGFGFDHYLAKPIEPSQLKNLLHTRQSLLLDRAWLVACVN